MSDVTDADRERAEEYYCGSDLIVEYFAAHRIAAERAAVERVVAFIRRRADEIESQLDGKPYGWSAEIKTHRQLADLLEREGAK